jgi:hypothetical protein
VDEPPKAPMARGKKQWQKSDLPHSMNNNEAWCKMQSTIYCHFDNQQDVWIYDDDKLAFDLRKIILAMYPTFLKQQVLIGSPIFCIVSIFFFYIIGADDHL